MTSQNLRVLTFNMLAPCYKRLYNNNTFDGCDRESSHQHLWMARLDSALTLLTSINPRPDILALQELWFHPPFLQHFESKMKPLHHIFYAKRPHSKQDGLAILILKTSKRLSVPTQVAAFPIPNCTDTDRIALAVSSLLTPSTTSSPSLPTHLLIVNTHLTFPHSFINRRQRELQADSLTSFVSSYANCSSTPISALILGDFNSELKSNVIQRITKEKYINCYVSINGTKISPPTHFNHMKQQVFVDHVFLSNQFTSSLSNPTLLRRPRSLSRQSQQNLDSSNQPRSVSPSPVGIRDTAPSNSNESITMTKSSSRITRRTRDLSDLHQHETLRCYIHPVASTIYPQSLPTDTWPSCFQISDHRPVAIEFDIQIASTT